MAVTSPCRNGSAAADVPGNSVAHRPAAGATRRPHDERSARKRQGMKEEVRLHGGTRTNIGGSAQSIGGFDRLGASGARFTAQDAQRGHRGPNHRESGQCRFRCSAGSASTRYGAQCRMNTALTSRLSARPAKTVVAQSKMGIHLNLAVLLRDVVATIPLLGGL